MTDPIRIAIHQDTYTHVEYVEITPEIARQIVAISGEREYQQAGMNTAMERIAALEKWLGAHSKSHDEGDTAMVARVEALESQRPATVQVNPHYDHQRAIDALAERVRRLEGISYLRQIQAEHPPDERGRGHADDPKNEENKRLRSKIEEENRTSEHLGDIIAARDSAIKDMETELTRLRAEVDVDAPTKLVAANALLREVINDYTEGLTLGDAASLHQRIHNRLGDVKS